MFHNHCFDVASSRIDENVANALLDAHPLLITSLVESYWRHGPQRLVGPFASWPDQITDGIEGAFAAPMLAAGHPAAAFQAPRHAMWDHLIYAYLIENTKIYDIFLKVLQSYRTGEGLGVPSRRSQLFWRSTEALVYSDAPPTTIGLVTSRARPDEVAQRMSKYWSMLGLELSHAAEVAAAHPYTKPECANTDFRTTFESLVGELWRGLVNARNIAGPNDADDATIALRARHIHQTFTERRQHGNIALDEYRAVTVMSWLHLAVSFDSSVVVDLSATMGNAGSAGDRLARIAERVGMTPHPHAQALFDLARPLSILLRLIETGRFDDAAGANWLYTSPGGADLVRTVIAQYQAAMGQDMKATRVTVVKPTPIQPQQMQRLPAVARSLVPANH